MKFLQTAIFASVVAFSSTVAWAQFGLYGSPEVLNLAPVSPAIVPYAGQAAPGAYPLTPGAPAMQAGPMVPAPPRPGPQYPGPLVQAVAADQYAGVPAEPAPPRAPPLEPSPSPTGGAVQGPSVVDQMLSEAGSSGDPGYGGPAAPVGFSDCDVPYGQCGHLTRAVHRFEQAAIGLCGGGYGYARGYGSPWYASAYALVMSRNKANNLWTSYDDADQTDNPYPPYDWDWRWGGEIRFGRRFCCGCSSGCGDCGECGDTGGFSGARVAGGWALEATYWTLEEFVSLGIVNQFGAVSTTLNFAEGNVSFGGTSAQVWFDGAEEHRVQRRSEVHSIEVALVRNNFTDYYSSPWELDWSVGVRYFRFDDRLVFSSLRDTGSWSNPGDVAYLEDHITNSLIGFQFGIDAAYYIRPRWRVFLTPEFGIYNNHIVNDFRLHLGDGTVATQSAYAGLTYPVHSTDDVLSFLTQVDLGLEWQFAQRWSARIGYRVVVATGIGLADNQVPFYITDIPEIADIDHNGELVLHGAFAGLTYKF